MSRFIPGDYVRPINPAAGLPCGSVWVVSRYHNKARGAVELCASSLTARDSYPPSHVIGRVFADHNFEKVVMVGGQWKAAPSRTVMVAPVELGVPAEQLIAMADPVESADMLVEQAAAALAAAKESARKAREEARARDKAEAKRRAAVESAKRAFEEHRAIEHRLHKDRGLAEATVALIAELSRLHNGGAEQPAASSIAEHAEQLQPLAKSYGYKIAKPGVIAIVVKA